MIIILSVCTPTYNRGYTLERLYNSLLNQTDPKFEWIIIDDGSTDETKELIKKFINEKKIKINYRYQENQGKHLALNNAYNLSEFEYIICLDSDDWLVPDAVEIMNRDYIDIIKKDDNLIGAVYLDKDVNSEIIGSELPNGKSVNWIDLKHKYKMRGDKCYAFKKNALLASPFASFENNKHMPPSYQYYLMSEYGNVLTINKALKIVEYLHDGISNKIKTYYFTAPENYTYYRKNVHNLLPYKKDKIVNIILYNISYINSDRNKSLAIEQIKPKLLSLILLPVSVLLSFYYKNVKKIV